MPPRKNQAHVIARGTDADLGGIDDFMVEHVVRAHFFHAKGQG